MKIENVSEAKNEANRLLRRIKELETQYHDYQKSKARGAKYLTNPISDGGAASAAVKRSSMDLSSALSKLRRA